MSLRTTKDDDTRALSMHTWGRPPSAVRPSEARQLEEFRQSKVEGDLGAPHEGLAFLARLKRALGAHPYSGKLHHYRV